MIRTIRQRIYGLALLPLAGLAMALLVLNGFARVEQARSELRNGQRMVVELLQARAVEALVVGNVLAFDEVTGELLRNSTSIACIVLEDMEQRAVSRHGLCGAAVSSTDRFAVRAALGEGLSDFDSTAVETIGHIGVAMDEAPVRAKRQQIVIQLAISLLLIALVLGITQRLLRRRLVEPIEQIQLGMNALGEGAYHTRIPVYGDDELARLGQSINATIERIAAYTRELERRRDEASRALQEADDEGLARDALVSWLTEDLEGPLHAMQAELTAVAVANNDPSLKTGIRRALALLQDARANLTELMQVAATHRPRPVPPSHLTDLWLDLQQDIRQYTDANATRVALTLTGQESGAGSWMGDVSADIDSVRLRKAVLYLIEVMGRHCLDRALQINAQFVPVAEDQLHVVFTLTASYDAAHDSGSSAWIERVSSSAFGRVPPAQMRLTDREARIVDHLLRSIAIAPTYSVSESGSVNVVIELTCRFSRASLRSNGVRSNESNHGLVVAGIVSDDPMLLRLLARGDLAHVEFRMISLAEALTDVSVLRAHTVLLIDVSSDVSDAFTLIHRLRAESATPPLIAICPPGRMGTHLSGRLLDAGFTGIVQKPVQYARLIEVIEAALEMPQRTRSLDPQFGR